MSSQTLLPGGMRLQAGELPRRQGGRISAASVFFFIINLM